jgi:propionyl-CoA carboxylase alpha chain
LLAAVAASVDHVANERKRQISGQMRTARPVQFEPDRTVSFGDQRFHLTLDSGDEGLLIRFDDASAEAHHVASEWSPGTPVWTGTINDEPLAVQIRPILNGYHLAHRGMSLEARVYTRREAELAALMPDKKAAGASKVLLCPMPGLVKGISVKEGQEVKAGEPLCIVEAMKMENVLRAERDVKIAKILAKEGDSLAVDAPIMEFA